MKAAANILKKVFWQDKLAFSLILTGLLLNAIGWGILYWQIKPTQVGIILHYNIYFGIDIFLGDYIQLFQASIGGLLIWAINLMLGILLYGQVINDQYKEAELRYDRKKRYRDKDYFLDYFDAKRLSSYLLWGAGVVVQAIILVYAISVIVVNK